MNGLICFDPIAEAVDNCELHFEDFIDKLLWSVIVFENHSICVFSIAQERFELDIRLHLNIIVVQVGVLYFWQGPLEILTDCQRD